MPSLQDTALDPASGEPLEGSGFETDLSEPKHEEPAAAEEEDHA
jgi:hypothetical protein